MCAVVLIGGIGGDRMGPAITKAKASNLVKLPTAIVHIVYEYYLFLASEPLSSLLR
jgi:hypothetical protein